MRRLAVAATALSLAACGSLDEMLESKIDYKSQGKTLPTLEVPPDLTAPARDKRAPFRNRRFLDGYGRRLGRWGIRYFVVSIPITIRIRIGVGWVLGFGHRAPQTRPSRRARADWTTRRVPAQRRKCLHAPG